MASMTVPRNSRALGTSSRKIRSEMSRAEARASLTAPLLSSQSVTEVL